MTSPRGAVGVSTRLEYSNSALIIMLSDVRLVDLSPRVARRFRGDYFELHISLLNS